MFARTTEATFRCFHGGARLSPYPYCSFVFILIFKLDDAIKGFLPVFGNFMVQFAESPETDDALKKSIAGVVGDILSAYPAEGIQFARNPSLQK